MVLSLFSNLYHNFLKRKSKEYGLIGKSLGHSFSKTYFTAKFEEAESDETYENFELSSIRDFPELLKSRDLKGLNVTIPYKEDIIPFLNKLSPEAKQIGAVNTVKFEENGQLIGHNTDAFGFHQSIKPFLRGDCHRALILGTGGASKAVQYVLEGIGIDCFFISRNPKGERQYSYSEINENMVSTMGLIVNTTPLGTSPNIDECPDFPFEFLTENHHVYDLIYNPEKTKFLHFSEMNGATIQNGYQMLIHQAEKAYEIWNSSSRV